jgi:hypothetical protein
LIFVDSNIPMYLVGGAHPNKIEAQLSVERLIVAGERLVTDAEVMQEILHRYAAIQRREAIGPALQTLLRLVDDVFPVEKRDGLRAAEMVAGNEWLSARDAIHLAVMERQGISTILSFDSDFDRWVGVRRIWRV